MTTESAIASIDSTANSLAASKCVPGSSNDRTAPNDNIGLPVRLHNRPTRVGSETSDEYEVFHDVQEQQANTDDEAEDDDDRGQKRRNGLASAEEMAISQEASEQGIVTSREPDSQTEGTDSAPDPKPPAERTAKPKPSEYSHQSLTLAGKEESDDAGKAEDDSGWQEMPALGEADVYDDFGRLVAKGSREDAETDTTRNGPGGFASGYARVQMDDDAKSSSSLDEDTDYLFKEGQGNSIAVDDEIRDATSQLQTTKDILTESQRIAYVGVVRLIIYRMMRDLQEMPMIRGSRNAVQKARDSIKKWGQMVMGRLYLHMEIDSAEQIMIEQLPEHGVHLSDLVTPLVKNGRVGETSKVSEGEARHQSEAADDMPPPPPYEELDDGYVPEVHTEAVIPSPKNLDVDLRWTVLCDLFLVLISDESYDARSRTLLKNVGEAMDVAHRQICRFEKRVMDALEVQEAAASMETWDESEHMEKRRKMALKKKYMVMGLATVSGGVVIGLSAGLLAPFIGAGLAAGFATVGVSGTSAFLGGAGGTALIASGATLTGSTIGLRASNKRTGAVRTFEYRPLHNNKRFNLIVTVSGWMSGDMDDVRLPYSTVDPIMGDIYSVLWEPEMLQSMGDTVKVLASEVSSDIHSNMYVLLFGNLITPAKRPLLQDCSRFSAVRFLWH